MNTRVVTTKTGIRIGSAWLPRRLDQSADADKIQAALLEPIPVGKRPWWYRLLPRRLRDELSECER